MKQLNKTIVIIIIIIILLIIFSLIISITGQEDEMLVIYLLNHVFNLLRLCNFSVLFCFGFMTETETWLNGLNDRVL